SGPFAEQHPVADLEIDRNELAAFVAAARTDADDLALGGLLLGGVRDDDAAGRLGLGVDTLDHDAVVKRSEFHLRSPAVVKGRRVFEAFCRGLVRTWSWGLISS